jgi:hypothetical protein
VPSDSFHFERIPFEAELAGAAKHGLAIASDVLVE